MRYSIHSFLRSTALLLLVGVLFLGCSEAPTAPFAGEVGIQAQDATPTLSLSKGPHIASATGSGHFVLVDELRTFQFTIRGFEDGSAKGQFEMHNRDFDQHVHGVATCYSTLGGIFMGDIFIVGGVFTKTNIGLDGKNALFWVQDNGEGANGGVDRVSFIFGNVRSERIEEFCTNPSGAREVEFYERFLPEIEEGNVQVRGI